MRPEAHYTGVYAAPAGTDTKALSALPDIHSVSRNWLAAVGYICRYPNSSYAAQRATSSYLTWAEEELVGFREDTPSRQPMNRGNCGNHHFLLVNDAFDLWAFS